MTNKDPTQSPPTRKASPETQHRKAEVVRLKLEGRTFREIAAELDIHFSYAHDLYWQAMADIPAPAVQAVRASLTEKLERWMEKVEQIADAQHLAHAGGKIVYDDGVGEDGQMVNKKPLLDTGPNIAAIREARKLADSLARLHGANAPTQVSIGGEIRFEIAGVDMDTLK